MTLERIVWSLAMVAVAAAAFFGGQQIGFTNGQQSRAAAMADFFARRGQNGGPPGTAAQPGAANGQQPGAPGGFAGQGVAGVVESINGNRLVVTGQDGANVTIELASDVVIRRQVDAQASDIKPGERINAFGEQNGDVFQARSVQIGGQRPGR